MTYSQTLANHILDTLKKTLTDKGCRSCNYSFICIFSRARK